MKYCVPDGLSYEKKEHFAQPKIKKWKKEKTAIVNSLN